MQTLQSVDVLINKYLQKPEWMWGETYHTSEPEEVSAQWAAQVSSPKHRHGSTHARISPQPPGPRSGTHHHRYLSHMLSVVRVVGDGGESASVIEASLLFSVLEIFELHSFRCHYCKVTAEPAWVSERGPSALILNSTIFAPRVTFVHKEEFPSSERRQRFSWSA